MKKRGMPLRCEYTAYAIICASDGVLCATMDGTNSVYATRRQAMAAIEKNARANAGVELSVAKCVVVPFEMWKGMQ